MCQHSSNSTSTKWTASIPLERRNPPYCEARERLDLALYVQGWLEHKTQLSLPNEQGRPEVPSLLTAPMNKCLGLGFEAIEKLSDGFNGVDLKNVVVEAEMSVIWEEWSIQLYCRRRDETVRPFHYCGLHQAKGYYTRTACKLVEVKEHQSEFLFLSPLEQALMSFV